MLPRKQPYKPQSVIRNPQSAIRNPRVGVVIAAGGTGTRVDSSTPKQFLKLAGKPVLLHALETILELREVEDVVIALPAGSIRQARKLIARRSWRVPIRCVHGGATRQESVTRGVRQLNREVDLILVHDAARPLCDRATMQGVMEAAWETGGAVPGLPATDTIQRVSRGGRILNTPPREELYAIQTPQGFRSSILHRALARAERRGFLGTDESSVVRWAGHSVRVVAGSPANIKITHPLDFGIAEMILSGSSHRTGSSQGGKRMIRTGHGIDFHRLCEGRRLILGGVDIPHEKGLMGHSDADVLCHAICDALLGACGLGDIGKHFPDSEAKNRGRSSLEFLEEARLKVEAAGCSIVNIDATVLAEKPKLALFMPAMQERIAKSLGLEREQVNIKATTTEGMNAEGRGEGISAHAVALVETAQSKQGLKHQPQRHRAHRER